MNNLTVDIYNVYHGIGLHEGQITIPSDNLKEKITEIKNSAEYPSDEILAQRCNNDLYFLKPWLSEQDLEELNKELQTLPELNEEAEEWFKDATDTLTYETVEDIRWLKEHLDEF